MESLNMVLRVVLVVCALVQHIRCRPPPLPRHPESWPDDAVLYTQHLPWDGSSYSFRFETQRGVARREQAQLKENDRGVKHLSVEGEYSYPTPDGAVHTVRYQADDQGYRARDTSIKNPNEKIYFDPNNMDTSSSNTNIQFNVDTFNANSRRTDLHETTYRGKVFRIAQGDRDRVVFPDERENNRIDTTRNNALTTTAVPFTTDGNFTNFDDYAYDELGIRMGVPPALLASLLGG